MGNRRGTAEAPTVSVLLAVPREWHASPRRLATSIDSILSQTLPDLELIVVDQGAACVPGLLLRYDDPRLKHLCIGTAAAAWEEGFGESSGRHIALLEAGDVASPTRLALQSTYLDAHPATRLLGGVTRRLQDGIPQRASGPRTASPAMLAWLLTLGLPPAPGCLMLPAQAARDLPGGLGRAGEGALDLCLRLSKAGDVARLDDMLTLIAGKPAAGRSESTAETLLPLYKAPFGEGAEQAALLVARHIGAGEPADGAATLQALSRIFAGLMEHAAAQASAADAAAIRQHADRIWRDVTQAASLRKRPRDLPAPRALAAPTATGRLFSTLYEPCHADIADPPTLFVVVDTEAEFDWSKPFTRDLTSVSAMDDIERGQVVFDRYGLRPIYVIDYPVASQERGFSRLRAIMQRDGCEIGAHLHPWTTPPFEEELCARNSYPGNLDPALEERKLAALMDMIRCNFGISPVFYKAGRYGFGPRTQLALERHGIKIDLSVLPGADLRRRDGPDFRALKPVLYRLAGTDLLSLPMTRSEVGLLPAMARLGERAQSLPGGSHLHLPSVLSRLGIAETITLTPEGVTADEQMRLIRAMLKRGHRQFVLHYHSPSLSPGNTPYATDQSGARTVITRLEQVCRYFFEEVGGIPGYPRDLLRTPCAMV
jgi:hypothetical protein